MKYDAFISYRHAELDQFVAENLHKKLEAFRLPKSIVKQRGKDSKKRIERVFRDRDELPLATNLADPITDALENSEFLIVICSPRLPQSLWCKKEIETFISMHGREKVLAVLIEGEPEESFPEELLYRTREINHEDGTVEIIKESVEPLAADVRGNTKKEVLKKMDEELLRLAAAMFECGYDDLKQRHKEQKMKKMLTASLAASAVFFVFDAVSTTMAIRIQSQKEQIQTQSEEIQAKSEEIRSQKEEIEVQYHQALYNQSLSMAEDSLELLVEGDRLEALRVAYEALGETEDGTSMPVTAEAQYALTESSYLYRDGYSIIPTFMIEHDANFALMHVSPNEERLLTVDTYGSICVWDIAENKLVCSFMGDYSSVVEENDCFFVNDNLILYRELKGWALYDIEKQTTIHSSEEPFSYGSPSKDGQFFSVVLFDGIKVYETETLAEMYSYSFKEGMEEGDGLAFSEDGHYAAFSQIPDWESEESGSVITLVNLENGEIVKEWSTEYSSIEEMQIVDNVLYAAVNQTMSDKFPEGDYDLAADLGCCLLAYDLESLSLKWNYQNSRYNINFFGLNGQLEDGYILTAFSTDVVLLNRTTGEEMFFISLGETVKQAYYYLNQNNFAVITRGGEYCFVNGNTGFYSVYEGYFCSNVTDVEIVKRVGNGFLLMPYYSNQITYMEAAAGVDRLVLAEFHDDISEVWINEAETRAVVELFSLSNGREVVLVDLTTGGVLGSHVLEDSGAFVGIVGDGSERFYICTRTELGIYSMEDGSLIVEYPFERIIFADSAKVSTDGTHLVLTGSTSFYAFDFADGSCEEITTAVDIVENPVIELANGMDFHAVTDKEEGAVLLYENDASEPDNRIDVTVPLVKKLLFTEDDKYLIVTYLNGSADVFETDTGTCVKEFEAFDSNIERIITISEDIGYMFVCSSDAYIVNTEWGVEARIDGGVAAMPETGLYLGVDDEVIYSYPMYTLEELKAEAEKILRAYNAME